MWMSSHGLREIQLILDKCNWAQITTRLASYCHTADGREIASNIKPVLTPTEITAVWDQTAPLKALAERGYTLPSLDMPSMTKIFKAIAYGQILDPRELQQIHDLLTATAKWYTFCRNMADDCATLRRFKSSLLTLPKIVRMIDKTIDRETGIKDDASRELKSVRGQKKNLQNKIEEKLKKMIYQRKFDPYLQDDFITVRNEKYVIPLRVDANGRVKGNAVDFSKSRETIFFEPIEIEKSNQLLQTIEFSESLICYRILQDLTATIAQEYDSLLANYNEIIALDMLHARARLAQDLNANTITLTSEPCLNLKQMFHPLLTQQAIKNSVSLDTHNTLIISGANAGGKTVMLQAVGLLHLMARAGLMVTAASDSEMFVFTQIHLIMDDEQNLSQDLSTFSSHLLRLQQVMTEATANDLVLIDEITTGTDPDTGAALAQAILEYLAKAHIKTIVTTHYSKLKELAFSNPQFRNAAMQFSTTTLKPTYRLLLDTPGQSFGLEISHSLGLETSILDRARVLRGENTQRFETALLSLQREKQQLQRQKNVLHLEIMKLQQYQDKWEQDTQEIAILREKLACEIKKLPPRPSAGGASAAELKRRLEGEQLLPKPPGKPLPFNAIRAGLTVYCLPLKKTAVILKPGRRAEEPLEISVGNFKTKVQLSDLRLL